MGRVRSDALEKRKKELDRQRQYTQAHGNNTKNQQTDAERQSSASVAKKQTEKSVSKATKTATAQQVSSIHRVQSPNANREKKRYATDAQAYADYVTRQIPDAGLRGRMKDYYAVKQKYDPRNYQRTQQKDKADHAQTADQENKNGKVGRTGNTKSKAVTPAVTANSENTPTISKQFGFDGYVPYLDAQKKGEAQMYVDIGKGTESAIDKKNQKLLGHEVSIEAPRAVTMFTNPALARARQYPIQYMTPKEQEEYRYIVGRYGLGTGNDYLEHISPQLENAMNDITGAQLRNAAEKNPAAGAVMQAGVNMVGGVMGAAATAKNHLLADGISETDPLLRADKMMESIRGGVQQGATNAAKGLHRELSDEEQNYLAGRESGTNSEDEVMETAIRNKNARNTMIDNAVSFLSETGMDIVNSQINAALLGSAGIFNFAGNAAGSALRDALGKDATKNQATMQAVAQGTAEALFERFSIENLQAMKAVPVKHLKDFVKNFVKSTATEASEEMATEVTNILTDRIIMGDKSDWNMDKNQMLANGVSESDTMKEMFKNRAVQVGLAGLGGALSGGVSAGVGSAIGTFGQGRAMRADIQNRYGSVADGYQDIADSVDDSTVQGRQVRSMAQEYADRVRAGGKVSSFENAYLNNAIMDNILQAEKAQAPREELPDAETKTTAMTDENNSTAAEWYNSQENAAVYENNNRESDGNMSLIQAYATRNQDDQQTEADIPEDGGAMAENAMVQAQETSIQNPQASQKESEHTNMQDVQRGMIERLGKTYSKNGRKALEETYDPETSDAPSYFRAFNRVYTEARYGSTEREVAAGSQAVLLNNDQLAAAFKAGYADREAEMNAVHQTVYTLPNGIKRKAGGVIIETSQASAELKKVADVIGKKTGLVIRLVDSEKHGAWGVYNDTMGTISVNVNSENVLQTLTHEITHYLKDYAPEEYQFYKDIVMNVLMKDDDFDSLKAQYTQAYEDAGQSVSEEDVTDEMVADASGWFLNDKEFANEVVNGNRNLGRKILDFIENMIDALKELISDTSIRRSADVLKNDLKEFEAARYVWMQALDVGQENFQKGHPSRQTELRYATKFQAMLHPEAITQENLEQNIRKVQEMKVVAEINEHIFQSKEKLSKQVIDFFEGGQEYENSLVGKIKVDNRAIKDDLNHGLTSNKVAAFAAIPNILRTGLPIMYSGNHKGRGYDTVMLGSKIKLMGEDYYAIGVVKLTEFNRLYLHDVKIRKSEGNEQVSLTSFPLIYNGSRATANYLPTITSLFDLLNGVNQITEENIKFQLDLKDSVEQTKTLIAVHNLTADKLEKMAQYDGIPMPSIAVTKASIGHENFGDISFMFDRNTIAPETDKRNKVYGADAWTAMFPQIEYEADDKAAEHIKMRLREYQKSIPPIYAEKLKKDVLSLGDSDELTRNGGYEGMLEKARDNIALKAAYLASRGENIENRTVEERIGITPEKLGAYQEVIKEFDGDVEQLKKIPVKEYMNRLADAYERGMISGGANETEAANYADGVRKRAFFAKARLNEVLDYQKNGGEKSVVKPDVEGMKSDIESRVDMDDYMNWIRQLYAGIEKGTGVWNGKEYITPSGNRRTFKQLHYEVTAENIVKSMLAQAEDARNVTGYQGAKSIRAVATEEFGSVEDVHRREDMIQDVSSEEQEEALNEINNRLSDLIGSIIHQSGRENEMMAIKDLGDTLIEVARKKPTGTDVAKELERYNWSVSEAESQEIADIINEIISLPVNLFEAKPQRVVGWDEVKAALVPKGVPENVMELLTDKGIKNVLEYDPQKKGDRLRKMQSLEHLRFQLDINDTNMTKNLSEENEKLKQANVYLTNMLNTFKGLTPSRRDITKVASRIIGETNSKAKQKSVADKIERLYTYMRSAENIDGAEVQRVAASIAQEVLNQATWKNDAEQALYDQIKGYLHKRSIYVPKRIRDDIAGIGGYESWRRSYFGRIFFTGDQSKGQDISEVYSELSDIARGMLNPDAWNQAEQVREIAKLLDDARPREYQIYEGADYDEQANFLAKEIMDAYFDVGDENVRSQYTKSYAQVMEQAKEEVKREYKRNIAAVRIETDQQLQKLQEQLKRGNVKSADVIMEINKLNDYRRIQREAADRRWIKKRDRFIEGRNRTTYKKEIIRDARKLLKMATQPTDKEHVPEAMKKNLLTVLEFVDFMPTETRDLNTSEESEIKKNVPGKRAIQAAEFKASLRALADKIKVAEDAGGVYTDEKGVQVYWNVDPDLSQNLRQLAEQMELIAEQILEDRKSSAYGKEDVSIDNLNTYDLKTLRDALASIKNMITQTNMLLANENYKHVQEIGERTLTELSTRKSMMERVGTRTIRKILESGMLDTYTFMHRFGDSGEALYQELRDGLDQKVRNTKIAIDYMEKLKEKHNLKQSEMNQWQKEVKTFRVKDAEVRATDAQIMSLYLLDKRGQARKHMYADDSKNQTQGGIKFSSVRDGLKYTDGSKVYKVTPEDVSMLVKQLTPQQRAVADAVGRFFAEQTSEWGNDVTMRLYGYKKFIAKDYFPIVVDKTTVAKTTQQLESGMTTLKNLGATKSVSQFASNPLVVEDIFDVYTRQADQMGSYNAFMISVSDFQKWYNYKNEKVGMQSEIERVLGKDANAYIMELLRDLNGSRAKADPYDSITQKLSGAMKSAAVGGNLRVIVQQPTAYAKAALVMNPKYLIEALPMTPKEASRQWELCKQYAPIAQWKDWGYFEINVGRSMEKLILGDDSLLEKAKELSMWGAGMGDQVAWVRMWKAAQLQVEAEQPTLQKGSEEFYTAAGRVFSRVIDTTQVVDSVLHRSDMMKSKSANVKAVTSFMSEPMKTWCMLYRAGNDMMLGRKGAKQQMVRTAAIYFITAAITAAAASLVSALRDSDKDREYGEKWKDAFLEDFSGNVFVLNQIPYAKDIISIMQGYDASDAKYTGIEDLMDAITEAGKLVNGESKYTVAGYAYKYLADVFALAGLPVKAFMRDTGAVIDTVLNETGNVEGQYLWSRLQYAPGAVNSQGSFTNRNMYLQEALRAYAKGNQALGDQIMQDLIDAGIDEDKLDKGMENLIKDDPDLELAGYAYLEGDKTVLEQIRERLKAKGYSDAFVDKKIESKANSIKKKEQPYQNRDIVEAFISGDSDAKKMTKELIEYKKKIGKTEKEVIASIKSMASSMYKNAYMKGTATERSKIVKNLYKLVINGKQLYSETDFKRWEKERNKN